MDKEELSETHLNTGKEILTLLDDGKFPVTSAFWFFQPDMGWRFNIATPLLETHAPEVVYKTLLQTIIPGLGDNSQSINEISLILPNHHLVQLIKMMVSTDASAKSGIRLTGNIINGYYIEDAYLYRIS